MVKCDCPKALFTLLIVVLLSLLVGGCGKKPHSDKQPSQPAKATQPAVVSDAPLAAFQSELLDFAFETASAIPVYPHIKDRSKAQYNVVEAALKLDQPQRAETYIKRIDNWRRGAGYADLALYYARHQSTSAVQHYLDLANEVAQNGVESEKTSPNTPQEWRRDHIRTKIAQTYAYLGMIEKANSYTVGVEDAEVGKVAAMIADVDTKTPLDEQIKGLDDLVAQGKMEIAQNAIEGFNQLFENHYQDADKRRLIEDKIKTSWNGLPIIFRVRTLHRLADIALQNNDFEGAIGFANQAQQMIDAYRWDLEYLIPLQAKTIALRYRAGMTEQSLADAAALLEKFDAEKEKIVNIFRVGALIPLAETYQQMGDANAALTVYKKAVEEGVDNPNSRPRAEDLSAIAASMALSAVEPDAELWTRMHQIHKGLGQPW